jgi:hypothetical protein
MTDQVINGASLGKQLARLLYSAFQLSGRVASQHAPQAEAASLAAKTRFRLKHSPLRGANPAWARQLRSNRGSFFVI